jgi:hypothetical protein
MNNIYDISADEEAGKGGGGPDEDIRYTSRTLRSHGFLSIAFGFALGLTLVIFFGLFRLYDDPPFGLKAWVAQVHPNLWFTFIIGFIGGTLLSAIYNFLIFRRINLFGLDRNLD